MLSTMSRQSIGGDGMLLVDHSQAISQQFADYDSVNRQRVADDPLMIDDDCGTSRRHVVPQPKDTQESSHSGPGTRRQKTTTSDDERVVTVPV